MASEGEECVHPTEVDQYSLVRGQAKYHGGKGLEVAADVGGGHDPFILDE